MTTGIGSFDNGRINKGTDENPGFPGKPSKHDFLYILFPVLTGDSGFIMTGLIRTGEGGNNGTSD
jgi:hypothetical protein